MGPNYLSKKKFVFATLQGDNVVVATEGKDHETTLLAVDSLETSR